MDSFDFEDAKQKISKILSIVEMCPEALKEKCFELLYASAFRVEPSRQSASASEGSQSQSDDEPKGGGDRQHELSEFKLPGNVLSFTRRYDVEASQIHKLFMLDHDPMLPIYKIDSKVMATAQLQKVMMILLENGLLNDKMKAPYTELRDSVREDGLMDRNFSQNMKKNADLFRGAITKEKINEDEMVELTGDGMTKLAEIVKQLAGPAD